MTGGNRTNSFDYIIEPSTGKKISIFSNAGKSTLKKYVKLFMKGGANQDSVFTPDMCARDFSCSQPDWAPACV